MSAKVYSTVPGLEMRIGNYGVATNTEPAIVPDDVAEQLEREIRGISHYEEGDDPATPGKTTRHAVKFGRGPNTQLRVEREEKSASKPSAVAPKAASKGEEKS
jgi:hypothetical protein